MQKRKRIGIDLTGIWRRPTGIFRYTLETTKHLLASANNENELDFTLFFAREIHPDFMPFQHTFHSVICPTRNELISKQCWFPAKVPQLKLDVMHYPSFPPPYIQSGGPKLIMTFYDTTPWRHAQSQTLHGRIYFRTLLARGARTSTQMVTLSEHARTEISKIMGKHYLSKIVIAPGAVEAKFGTKVSSDQINAVRHRYQLPSTYLLTVATVEPRKNLPTLLNAYLKLREKVSIDCPPLIVVGREGWNCQDILNYMQDLGQSVHFLGHVPDADLITLYQNALYFIFPSLYEGFGLPVIEAMTAGCPVITTTSSSLPEIAGDAALLIDPLDAQGMADCMQQLLYDQNLRKLLIIRGYNQAQHFSWWKTAQIHRELYTSV